VGPAGSMISAPRLYDFDIWNLRMFMKLSLEAVLPQPGFIGDEVDKLVDPGEWGIQNYCCRLVSVFLFLLAVFDDLNSSMGIVTLLWRVPADSAAWIGYEVPQWGSKTGIKMMKGWTELDFVTFKVRGMPRHWKLVNFILIVIPKTVLWYVCSSLGFHFLMETSAILGSIMNSLALAFILDMDEMVFETMTTHMTKHIMKNLEDYCPEGHEEEESANDETNTIKRFIEKEVKNGFDSRRCLQDLLPRRLLNILALNLLFTLKYYYMNCKRLGDGSWVSVQMYLPEGIDFKPLQFLFGGMDMDSSQPEPYWSMPDG